MLTKSQLQAVYGAAGFSASSAWDSLFPVKGECLSVWNDDTPLTKTLYHDHCYVVPRKSGRLVIGATMKQGDWSDTPDIGGIEAVIAKAKTMLPAIEHMKIDRFWAGLRPGTKTASRLSGGILKTAASSRRRPFSERHPVGAGNGCNGAGYDLGATSQTGMGRSVSNRSQGGCSYMILQLNGKQIDWNRKEGRFRICLNRTSLIKES